MWQIACLCVTLCFHAAAPLQVVQYLRTVNYTNLFGDTVHFDENGDPAGAYDIVNWQTGSPGGPVRYVTVGRFDSSLPPTQQLLLHSDSIVWHRGTREVSDSTNSYTTCTDSLLTVPGTVPSYSMFCDVF